MDSNGLVAFTCQLNHAVICGITFWHWRSEELLKLGGGQKIFIFRGGLPFEAGARLGGWVGVKFQGEGS